MCGFISNPNRRTSQRILALLIVSVFTLSSIVTPSRADIFKMPEPGERVSLSKPYQPTVIRGITIKPENSLSFDFIIDIGDSTLEGTALEDETRRLIKYFLAGLTIPDDQVWVNLSPYEHDLMIPTALGVTEMGKDMLEQDYMLKQISASLTDPESELGKEFWGKVYKKAYDQFGTTDIPINMFNKVWIVPDKATVLEQDGTAFVVDNYLKVMLEEDFLALKENINNEDLGTNLIDEEKVENINNISISIIKEIIIPELEKEVNEGKNFALIRQVYNSVILATWFKKSLKESFLGQVYVDKNKVAGVDVEDKKVKEKIYNQYVVALQEGVYDLIKEDFDIASQTTLARRYFSGGVSWEDVEKTTSTVSSAAQLSPEKQRVVANVATEIIRGLETGKSKIFTVSTAVRERGYLDLRDPAAISEKVVTTMSPTVVSNALRGRVQPDTINKITAEVGHVQAILENQPEIRLNNLKVKQLIETQAPNLSKALGSKDVQTALIASVPDVGAQDGRLDIQIAQSITPKLGETAFNIAVDTTNDLSAQQKTDLKRNFKSAMTRARSEGTDIKMSNIPGIEQAITQSGLGQSIRQLSPAASPVTQTTIAERTIGSISKPKITSALAERFLLLICQQ